LMGISPDRVIVLTFALGGLLLGLFESLGTGYLGELTGGVFGSNYQDVFAFLVLIAVLVFRPSGLLGERIATRA
ncbi:branched-chain amino acid ABC transporter permease, partial [Serratia nematodiphila]